MVKPLLVKTIVRKKKKLHTLGRNRATPIMKRNNEILILFPHKKLFLLDAIPLITLPNHRSPSLFAP
jgi:hypothetical protein